MSNERDEHDPVELTGIDKAIEDCTAAVVTELDDGEHEELRASIRMLIDFVKQTRKPSKHLPDCGCPSCWSQSKEREPQSAQFVTVKHTAKARDEYMTWMRGWRDGAGRRACDPSRSVHPSLGAIYDEAYAAGQKSAKEENERASVRFGYKPLVIHICADGGKS